jgi:hypothetical protein
MAPNELHPRERATLLATFAAPIPAAWLGQQEDIPGWWLVRREGDRAWIRNGSWAVAELRLQGDYVVGVEPLEPEAARQIRRRWGYGWSASEREWLLASLVPGAPLDATLDGLFSPRRIGVRALGVTPGAEGDIHWYRRYEAGLFGVELAGGGLIARVTLVEGEAAADLFESLWREKTATPPGRVGGDGGDA